MLNKWFKPADGDRPDFLGKAGEVRVQGGQGEGDWELEWHPRSRVGTCTMPARRVLRTLQDEEDRDLLREKLTTELKMLETKGKPPWSRVEGKSYVNLPQMPPDSVWGLTKETIDLTLGCLQAR